MYTNWFREIEMPFTRETWDQLPRSPGYKYELLDGIACISPRHNHEHCTLSLEKFKPTAEFKYRLAERLELKPLNPDDHEELASVMAAAFHHVPPFEILDPKTRLEAARDCLQVTWAGREGEYVADASFAAHFKESSRIAGAIMVTLVKSCANHEMIVPHLTWLFVCPTLARSGIGGTLLAASVAVLKAKGHPRVESTMQIGNQISLFWHWQQGFELLSRGW